MDEILLSACKTAKILGISRSTLYDYHARGLVPMPIKIRGRVLWRKKELERWTEAGCPVREKWNLMQTTISMKEVSN